MLESKGFTVINPDDVSRLESVDGCPFELRTRLLADIEKNKLRELRKIATPFWQIKNEQKINY
tara:strand:- start:2113 stop:2301 length:189 start_codon:yes stop_codon:yes gene_type:complete